MLKEVFKFQAKSLTWQMKKWKHKDIGYLILWNRIYSGLYIIFNISLLKVTIWGVLPPVMCWSTYTVAFILRYRILWFERGASKITGKEGGMKQGKMGWKKGVVRSENCYPSFNLDRLAYICSIYWVCPRCHLQKHPSTK